MTSQYTNTAFGGRFGLPGDQTGGEKAEATEEPRTVALENGFDPVILFVIMIGFTLVVLISFKMPCCKRCARRQHQPAFPLASDNLEKKKQVAKKCRGGIVSYFEASGNQMTVAPENLVETERQQAAMLNTDNSTAGDIELGYTDVDENAPSLLLEFHRIANKNPASSSSAGKENTSTTMPEGGDAVEIGCECTQQEEEQRHCVSDCCAICLNTYEESDIVVWSCDLDCTHVFHRECIVEYLLAHRGNDSPCPMCRRNFCNDAKLMANCEEDMSEKHNDDDSIASSAGGGNANLDDAASATSNSDTSTVATIEDYESAQTHTQNGHDRINEENVETCSDETIVTDERATIQRTSINTTNARDEEEGAVENR